MITVRVLWITGPMGVGKSTASWQLFTELASSGTCTAFADADQLCICYPAPPDDPDRDVFRARNAAGDFADVCVDTTGVPAGEVARLIRGRCRGWPGFGPARGLTEATPAAAGSAAESQAHGCGGRVLLLFGPAGVGKSTIGFQLYLQTLRAGLTAGYVDLDQIGFLVPHLDGDPRNHWLKARNLAGIWRTYHAAGAGHLVMSGPVENQAVLRAYAAALPDAVITACRLHAGPAELRRRIMTRGAGGSWPQPGDPLRGQPESYLSQVAEQAVADARALDHTAFDALRIDTTGRTAGEAADLTAAAAAAASWPVR